MAATSPTPPDTASARLAALGLTPHAPEGFVGGWVPEQPVAGDPPQRGRHARGDDLAPGTGFAAAAVDRLPALAALVEAPSAGALLALLALCVGCVLVTGYTLLHHRGQASYAAPLSVPHSFAPVSSPSAAAVVVDVGGRVRRPGLVTLPLGSRVADALRAAGGALRPRDLLALNLAAKVSDGELLLVGMPGAAGSAGAGGTGGSSGPVDLNTATAEQLDALPGIGPVLAQHILDWRTAHGGFRTVDQLRDVSGIGDSTFADLAPLVTV